MAWSDTSRCLYCDGKLPLLRKMGQGAFCQPAHQEAYRLEQERLALQSLAGSHDVLLAATRTVVPVSDAPPSLVPSALTQTSMPGATFQRDSDVNLTEWQDTSQFAHRFDTFQNYTPLPAWPDTSSLHVQRDVARGRSALFDVGPPQVHDDGSTALQRRHSMGRFAVGPTTFGRTSSVGWKPRMAQHPSKPKRVVQPEQDRPVAATPGWREHWEQLRLLWLQSPRDLRVLLFAVPLGLALAFAPSLPKVSVKANPETELAGPVGQVGRAVESGWASLRARVSERAAVELRDDFRQGLEKWQGKDGPPRDWSFDEAGFVHPQSFALYAATVPLRDYEVTFLAGIDRGALSWMVRTRGNENGYALRLLQERGSMLRLVRYAVVNGAERGRVEKALGIRIEPGSVFRVRVTMADDQYHLAIDGQPMDAWTDQSTQQGGLGFWSREREQSRLGWVEVARQTDALGRALRYVAPPPGQ
jgi:hypothetical protein